MIYIQKHQHFVTFWSWTLEIWHVGTFAHNFCFVWKNIWLASEFIKYGSGAVHKLLNKTMQKLG